MKLTNLMSNVLGWILIIVGLIGFGADGFLGMHLNPAHNIVLFLTGVLSLGFGAAEADVAKGWCIVAGLVYGIISLIGIFSGPGIVTVANVGTTAHLFKLVPGGLEFGTADSWWQLLVGVLYLTAAFKPSKQDIRLISATAAREQKEAAAQR